ncbi:hypothetical protein LguiB_018038 [Lonicera macranthoides]
MILLVALIIVFIRGRKRGVELQTQLISLPHAWRRVSYIELLQATNGFNEINLLAAGGVGSVYKGTLSDEPGTDPRISGTDPRNILSKLVLVALTTVRNLVITPCSELRLG